MRPTRLTSVTSFSVLTWMTFAGVIHQASASVSLSSLLQPNATFEVGGSIVFDQFTYTHDGSMPSPDSLVVQSTIGPGGELGIRLVGGMLDDPAVPGASTFDWTYRVSTTDGSQLSAATLAGNLAAFNGDAEITGKLDIDGTTLTIFDKRPPQTTSLLASSPIPATDSLGGMFELKAEGISLNGGATASYIDTSFDVVPEPASLLIWGGTLLVAGMVAFTYRRRSQAAVVHVGR